MKNQFLEAGKIVNTHGIKGEVKIVPWADSPEFLLKFKKFHINGKAAEVRSSYVHKGNLIVSFAGVDSVDDAAAMKDQIISIDRNDADIGENKVFIQDIIGLDVIDDDTGEKAGTVKDIYDMPAHSIYVIDRNGEILVPGVPEFIKEISVDGGYVRIRFIEGMEQ